MKTKLFILTALVLTSCGMKVDAPITVNTPPPTRAEPTVPIPTPDTFDPIDGGGDDSVPSTVSVTVYSLTKRVLLSGGTELFGVGSCVVYGGTTYCWDDGIKTHGFSQVTFWSLDATNSVCYTGCLTDQMETPTTMSPGVTAKLGTVFGVSQRSASQVFTDGVAETVECTETTGFLTCPNFLIDTMQSPL